MKFVAEEIGKIVPAEYKMAVAGFGLVKKDDDRNYRKKSGYTDVAKNLSTVSTLLTSFFKQDLKKHSVFCNGKYLSSECFTAR